MPTVDGGLAAWLKSPALVAVAAPGGVAWSSAQAVAVEFTSPNDVRADALTEAARTAALLGGPNVKDRVIVKGRRRDLLFKCVTIANSRLGYAGGKRVFVLGVAENGNNTTTLTVLRKLP